jgi:hypothetical protein
MLNLFKKKRTLTIEDNQISVHQIGGEDYICLTDMVRGEEGTDHIKNWMRNRNTVEFLGLWESMNNTDFKGVEFDTFRKEAGLNSFTLTPRKWIDSTNAKGIISKSGRYGGTYAHKDIAFEFGTWISPAFKLYLIKEYQRLQNIESNQHNLEWNVRRTLSKTNYQLHTDAIKEHVVPVSKKWRKELEYAEEADLLNTAIFGCTAKEWQKANPERHKAKENLRDSASINELVVLSNAESLNAEMIRDGLAKEKRFNKLQQIAKRQLEALNGRDFMKSIKKTSEDIYMLNNKDKKK